MISNFKFGEDNETLDPVKHLYNLVNQELVNDINNETMAMWQNANFAPALPQAMMEPIRVPRDNGNNRFNTNSLAFDNERYHFITDRVINFSVSTKVVPHMRSFNYGVMDGNFYNHSITMDLRVTTMDVTNLHSLMSSFGLTANEYKTDAMIMNVDGTSQTLLTGLFITEMNDCRLLDYDTYDEYMYLRLNFSCDSVTIL